MILLPRRQRWLNQPQGFVEVNWAHPLSDALVFGCLPNGAHITDIVYPARPVTVNGTGTALRVTPGREGERFVSTTTNNDYLLMNGPMPHSVTDKTGFTSFSRVFGSNTNQSKKIIFTIRNSANQGWFGVDFGSDGAGEGARIKVVVGKGSGNATSVSNFQYTANQVYNVVATIPIGTAPYADIYVDGVLDTGGTYTSNTSQFISTPSYMRVLSSSFGGQWLQGGLAANYTWARGLSSGEIEALDENPYQFLKTRLTRSYFLPQVEESQDGTATGVTLTVSTSLSDGAATGAANAPGVTLTTNTSLSVGTATGTANASGTTLTTSTSLTAGTPSGAANASGTTYNVSTSLVPGTASGTSAGVANGVTLTVSTSIVPGTANGSASASGTTRMMSTTLVVGSAQGTAVAQGTTLSTSTTLTAGTASGSANASGSTLNVLLELLAGQATGELNYLIKYAEGTLISKPTKILTMVSSPTPIQTLTQFVD